MSLKLIVENNAVVLFGTALVTGLVGGWSAHTAVQSNSGLTTVTTERLKALEALDAERDRLLAKLQDAERRSSDPKTRNDLEEAIRRATTLEAANARLRGDLEAANDRIADLQRSGTGGAQQIETLRAANAAHAERQRALEATIERLRAEAAQRPITPQSMAPPRQEPAAHPSEFVVQVGQVTRAPNGTTFSIRSIWPLGTPPTVIFIVDGKQLSSVAVGQRVQGDGNCHFLLMAVEGNYSKGPKPSARLEQSCKG